MATYVHAPTGNSSNIVKAIQQAKLNRKDKLSLALQVIGILGSWGITAYQKNKKSEVPADHDCEEC